MRYVETLASYLPSLIVEDLMNSGASPELVPRKQVLETVCMFCDVSGFTALSEAMTQDGKGSEGLAKHLNSYFSQMVRLIASEGGDVFKFAGDAMIVLWPPSEDELDVVLQRAVQCAISIQNELHQAGLEENVSLSVKVGIAVGPISILHIGGMFNRMEYIAVGNPFLEAFQAEHHAVAGDVILAPRVWNTVKRTFKQAEMFDDGYVRLDLSAKFTVVRRRRNPTVFRDEGDYHDATLERRIKGYVAGAVLPHLQKDSPEEEQWGSELRIVSTLFVNLGIPEATLLHAADDDGAMQNIHNVMRSVQEAVYAYEGSINKFLMDDKGSTLIACFGLPPVSHEDDPIRAVLSAIRICEKLFDLSLTVSVGITTGEVFCGVVGSKTRREYTVLGDSVNLAARLMQRASAEGGGIICDLTTRNACIESLAFQNMADIRVKGKAGPVKVFHPYPDNMQPRQFSPGAPNTYTHIHRRQSEHYATSRALRAMSDYFTRHPTSFSSYNAGPTTPRATLARASVVSKRRNTMSKTARGMTERYSSNSVATHSPAAKLRRPSSRSSIESTATTTLSTSSKHARFFTQSLDGELVNLLSALHNRPQDVVVNVPPYLRLANLHETCPALPPFDITDSMTLRALRDAAVRMAREKGWLHGVEIPTKSRFSEVSNASRAQSVDSDTRPSADLSAALDEDEDAFVLNITGTRMFLPANDIPLTWLAEYVTEAALARSLTAHDLHSMLSSGTVELTLTSRVEKATLQNRATIARRTLLESKIRLVHESRGSVLLLEGLPGVGKSHIISQFVGTTMPHTAPLMYVSGSPFGTEKPFGAYALLMQQYLDMRKARDELESRTAALELMLRGARREEFAHLLNPILYTKLPNPGSFPILDQEDIQLELMLHLFEQMCATGGKVCIIDDAHFLDHASWRLTLAIATRSLGPYSDLTVANPPNVMLVLAFRPLRLYKCAFSAIPPAYEVLRDLRGVMSLKIDGLPQDEIEELVMNELGANVMAVPEQLLKTFENRCDGIPAIILHMLKIMQRMTFRDPTKATTDFPLLLQYADFQDDSMSELNPGMQHAVSADSHAQLLRPQEVRLMDENYTFQDAPVPPYVQKLYGAILDNLNSCQVMILKTAALLGFDFDWPFLEAAYPIEGHKYRLRKELERLEELGLVVEIVNVDDAFIMQHYPEPENQGESSERCAVSTVGDRSGPFRSRADPVFRFTFGFMREVLLARMLKSQRAQIRERIRRFQEFLDQEKRKQFMKKFSIKAITELKRGQLQIQKEVTRAFTKKFKRRIQGGDWKVRTCVLQGNCLKLFKSGSDKTPTQILFLEDAVTEVEPTTAVPAANACAFHILVNRWQKDGRMNDQQRSFIFAAESAKEAEEWVFQIRYVIESNQTTDRSNHSTRKLRTRHTTIDKVLPAPAANADPDDCRLLVLVVAAKDLEDQEFCANTNRYLVADLDGVRKRTSYGMVSRGGPNPVFEEFFTYKVKSAQWMTGTLRVQIWDHDVYLTDDFLGEAVIELRDLEPEPYEPKAQVVAQNAKWIQLRRSALDDRSVGQLKVAFRLIMNAENVSPEQFKQMAAKATEVERKRTESFSSSSAPVTADTALSRDRKFTFDEVVDGEGELPTIDEEDRDSVSSQTVRFAEWNASTPAADSSLDRAFSVQSMDENAVTTPYWAEEIQGALEVDHEDIDDSDGEYESVRLETIPSMDMMHSDSIGLSESELPLPTSDAAKLPATNDSKDKSREDDVFALTTRNISSSSSSSSSGSEDQEGVSVPAPNDAIPS